MDTAPSPKLALRTAPYEGQQATAAVDAFVRELPPLLFARRGVVIPVPVWVQDESVSFGMGMLEAEGRVLGAFLLTQSQDALRLLEEHAAELLAPEMVAYFLVKLRTSWPALISAVEQRFTPDALTAVLRDRLRRGDSVRDLVSTLETILAETV
jgi:hypothetical protein